MMLYHYFDTFTFRFGIIRYRWKWMMPIKWNNDNTRSAEKREIHLNSHHIFVNFFNSSEIRTKRVDIFFTNNNIIKWQLFADFASRPVSVWNLRYPFFSDDFSLSHDTIEAHEAYKERIYYSIDRRIDANQWRTLNQCRSN